MQLVAHICLWRGDESEGKGEQVFRVDRLLIDTDDHGRSPFIQLLTSHPLMDVH